MHKYDDKDDANSDEENQRPFPCAEPSFIQHGGQF